MTAGASAVLMDTTDPAKPVYLTEIGDRARFSSLGYHSVEWARGGDDHFVVLGTEIAPAAAPGLPSTTENTAGSDCSGENSVVETWDARAVKDALERYEASRDPAEFEGVAFTKVDSYDASGRGLFVEGKAAASQLYCAHWMETRPDFKNGGVMAVGYYNRGTRFVEVDAKGAMAEIGWMTPAEGYAGSSQWVGSDAEGDIVYVMDYRRGLEVLRLTPDEATGVVSQAPDLIAPASAIRIGALERQPGPRAAGGAAVLLLLLVALKRAARRRALAVA